MYVGTLLTCYKSTWRFVGTEGCSSVSSSSTTDKQSQGPGSTPLNTGRVGCPLRWNPVDECHPTPHRQCSQIISKGHFPHKPRAVPMKLLWEPKRKCLKATVPTHLQTHRVWSRAHTSQEPWPWKCESQKESVQRPPSHHTSKII